MIGWCTARSWKGGLQEPRRITQLVVASDSVAASMMSNAEGSLHVLAVPHGIKLVELPAHSRGGRCVEHQRRLVERTRAGPGFIAAGCAGVDRPGRENSHRECRRDALSSEGYRVQILKALSLDDKDVAVFKKRFEAQGVFLETHVH